MKNRIIRIGVLAALLTIAGCAARPMGDAGDPGFWLGLWHGLISPVSLIYSVFSDEVRMYAFPNVGRLYDLGFFLGVGGLGAASR